MALALGRTSAELSAVRVLWASSPWCVVMKSISSCAGAPYLALRSSWHDNNLSICANNKGAWSKQANKEDGQDRPVREQV